MQGLYRHIALFTYLKGMLGNFLGNHGLWIWKTSHFFSHNLWLQKCSCSTYLANKRPLFSEIRLNQLFFCLWSTFYPLWVVCTNPRRQKNENFLLRKPRQICFISEMACGWCSCKHRPRTTNCWALSSGHRAAAPREVPAGGCQSQVSAAPSSHQVLVRFSGWDECGAEGSIVTSAGLGHRGAISASSGSILSLGSQCICCCASSVPCDSPSGITHELLSGSL